jgi:hypothetical protein
MQPIVISFFVVATSFGPSCYHAIYTGDTVAENFGYFVSMTILPAFTGGVIGCLGIYYLHRRINTNIRKYWWLPAIGAITSLVPTVIYVIGMSLPHH